MPPMVSLPLALHHTKNAAAPGTEVGLHAAHTRRLNGPGMAGFKSLG
ncbi:hypothetical protein OAL09_10310 [Verrucomicrobia bacterium]|nr:hypothetical protein [Verrucomicrobiota bacterium]